jgi:pectinesterase
MRPAWVRQLSDAEAKNYTVENILGGEDRWDPTK